jgi:hypothetical protein
MRESPLSSRNAHLNGKENDSIVDCGIDLKKGASGMLKAAGTSKFDKIG